MGVPDPQFTLRLLAEEMDETASKAEAHADRLIRKAGELVEEAAALRRAAGLLEGRAPSEPVVAEEPREEPVAAAATAAPHLNGSAPDIKPMTGRHGRVDLEVCAKTAEDLGEFTRNEFAEAVGLKAIQTSVWLNALTKLGLISRGEGAHYRVPTK